MNTVYVNASTSEQAVYTLVAIVFVIGLCAIFGRVWP